MKERFAGKRVLITGGTGCLGRVLASEFLQEGSKVILADILPADKAQEEIPQLVGNNHPLSYFQCDVCDQARVAELFEFVLDTLGGLDILVNCAAAAKLAFAEDMDQSSWDETIKVSLYGAFNCSQRAFPMLKESRGNIVSIASIAALIGLPRGTTHHSAAKAGLLGMTRSLAVEWAKHDIRVNAIAPGQFDTEPLRKVMADPDYAKCILDTIPLHRVGTKHEVAAGVLFLSSDDASFITGNTLVVDGGATIF